MPITLAIETSQRTAGVALRDRRGAVHAEPVGSGNRHDDDLMPAIARLCERCGVRPEDLELVGVSIGPGGFTGLRVAVTTAKMLAETVGAAVVPVESALVAANSCDPQSLHGRPGDLLIVLAVKNETVWLTSVTRNPGGPPGCVRWVSASSRRPGLVSAGEVELGGVAVVLGDRFLPSGLRDRCLEAEVPVVESTFDPVSCLYLAEFLAERGGEVDPLHLLPLYAREPEAVRLFRQRQSEDLGASGT